MSAVLELPCCGAWLCRERGLSETCFQVSAVQGESSTLQAERKLQILHLLAQHSHLREPSLLPWDRDARLEMQVRSLRPPAVRQLCF